MKQFVKALPKTGNFFKYLYKTFPHLSEIKIKGGLYAGPNIRKPMFNADFLLTMTEVKREAWILFNSVLTKFLGNNKDPDLRYYCCKYTREIQSLGVLNEFNP
jgi:hypothetical protein